MAKSKTSGQWLKEHFKDPFVHQSWKDGLRSRAAYKLIEIHEKDKLFKPGMRIVDLGAAPGGWSQVAAQILDGQGVVLATDILPMDPLMGVEFVQGDFREDTVFEALSVHIDGKPIDLVMSDIAPNMSGNRSVDQYQSTYLVELAVAFADEHLRQGGTFLCKAFQGEGFDEVLQNLRSKYLKVISRKPDASRSRSRELYLLAKNKKQ